MTFGALKDFRAGPGPALQKAPPSLNQPHSATTTTPRPLWAPVVLRGKKVCHPCHRKHFHLRASQDSPRCSSHPVPHMLSLGSLKTHLHLSDPLVQWKAAVKVPVRSPQTTQMYFLSLSSCAMYSKFPPSLVALCWGLSSLSASHAGFTQLDTGHRHVAGPRSACCSPGSSGSFVQRCSGPACLQLIVQGLDFICPCGSFWSSLSPLWACWVLR